MVREYIPGTQARRDRLFQQILSKEVGDRDGLALVEWEDGSVTMKPVVWESDLSAIIDPDSKDMWFARGRGAEPKNFNGIPIWHVYAGNAGVISTEACLVADNERWGDVVDVGSGEEIPDELYELGLDDPNGGRFHDEEDEVDGSVSMEGGAGPSTPQVGNGSGRAVSDGGVANIDENAAVYDLRPPDGFDGLAIDVRDADDFDPYPVTREDAKAAAEWFERSVDDGTDTWMKGFIVGIVVSVVLALIFLGGPWLAGEIAGGSGGGAGTNLPAALPFLAIGGRSLIEHVKEVAG